MHLLRISLLTLLSALPLLGCSSEPEGDKPSTSAGSPEGSTEGSMSGTPAEMSPTFHKDVEPILQKSCQGCHSPGRIAPFSLTKYEDAKAVAGLMAVRTEDGSMPPWSAVETAECQPRFGWKDDQRLSAAEIATIKAWSDAGAPEGDPQDAPSASGAPTDTGLSDVDLTIQLEKPYVTSGDADQFRCFVLDPKLTADAFLNGSHVIAGNPKVVHHAVVFVDPTGQSATKVGPDGSFDCFGGVDVENASVLAVWTPGAVPNEYPPNVGLPVPAGAKLVMQIHYHPAGTTADPDLTKLQLRFATGKPEYLAVVAALGNFPTQLPDGGGLQPGPNDKDKIEFLIPAGVKDHTETMTATLKGAPDAPPFDIKVYSSQTHMHYVGTDMRVTVNHATPQSGEPAEECLIETPKWDFNWQRSYAYNTSIDKLPSLRTGDVINLRCSYDNTLDNPFVKRALMEQKLTEPQEVTLGEGTLNEMCIGIFSLIFKNP